MKIALLTCKDLTGFIAKEESLVTALLDRPGVRVDTIAWDQEGANWGDYDVAIIRTTWDYTKRLEEFFAALANIKKSGCHLYNSLDLVHWNAHKSYLLELEASGVAIIPTVLWSPAKDTPVDWPMPFKLRERWIIKPAVGANADGTEIFLPKDIEKILSARKNSNKDYLIQPFLPEISKGELSFHFFNGELSHTVSKTPKSDDYRVQEEHGGDIQLYSPSTKQTALAKKAIDALKETPLFARVDMLPIEDGLWLMELELIEPALYFRFAPEGAKRFVNALYQRLLN